MLRRSGVLLACGCGAAALAVTTRRRVQEQGHHKCRRRRLHLSEACVAAMCGAAGEAAALAATYPLETLKVRCQTTGRSMQQVLTCLLAEHGALRVMGQLYHGSVPAVMTAMVTGAVYLSIFSWMQGTVQAGLDRISVAPPPTKTAAADGSQSDGPKWRDSSVLSAGISAGATSAIIACLELPSEVVRLRMQAGASAHMGFGQQLRQALADMHRIGGWTYLAPCLAKEVPQDATEFAAYGKLTRTWNAHMPANIQEVPGAEWLIGAGAGAAATLVSMPADVIKTRVSCVPPATLHAGFMGSLRSYGGAAGMIYREFGIGGFFQGTGPRLIKIPSTMVYWVTVEQTRRLLAPRECDCELCRAEGGSR
eukprot:jgi/Tetstr1/466089/TSEL_010673.t2